MSTLTRFPSSRNLHGPWSQRVTSLRLAVVAGATAITLSLTACGGGGEATVNDSATAAWATGPITGLGSIIVNGVRYDDSAARVENDDDGSVQSSSSLKIGMMVEINSSTPDDNSNRARASSVRFGSEIVGPIASVDATAQTINVLNQTIAITSTTVFDDSLGSSFAALTVGRVVEVHALYDATSSRYVATRIEDKDDALAYRLRGVVSNLNTTAKTFNLGSAVIAYGNVPAANLPVNLADGMKVRVLLATTPVNGQWVASAVRGGLKRVDDFRDARLRGLVSSITSPQSFEVNGIAVNASNARFEPNVSAVVLGAHVEVKGATVNGVVVATKVEVKGAREASTSWGEVALHGAMSALSIDTKTFVLRGVTVDYSAVGEWRDGGESNLANGRELEVKGAWSTDRTKLKASRIKFES